MAERIKEVIQNIRDSNNIGLANEMGIRQAAVLPLLDALGWDIRNLDEVIPEYVVGQNRVDYCLAVKNCGKVFIEVKAAREDLNPHREQLLKYAFQSGVPLAVLTNGRRWSFFLPLREGPWDKRCFSEINLLKESLVEVYRKLESFLSRSSVSSETAMTEATKMYESARKTDAIEQAIPKAWNKIIGEPDEFLVELLIDAVEEICQHRPEEQRIEEFLTHLPSFSTQDSNGTKKQKNSFEQSDSFGGSGVFPASVPPAFLRYGAFSIKAQYREFMPANQEGLDPQDRTYFAVNISGYGEARAYMSQGRLKIKDANEWREICAKLRIKPNNEFLVTTIRPSEYYEVNKR